MRSRVQKEKEESLQKANGDSIDEDTIGSDSSERSGSPGDFGHYLGVPVLNTPKPHVTAQLCM